MEEQSPYLRQRLRVALAAAGLTQSELARQMCVANGTVTRMLNDGSGLSSKNLVGFCRVTGCSIEWLLCGEPVDVVTVTR